MSYRAIELYFNPDADSPPYNVHITQQVESALENVPRAAIVSITYAPFPARPDHSVVLIVLDEA
jgi:hypothetical protein